MVWYGMVWYGMVWYGIMVWYGMVCMVLYCIVLYCIVSIKSKSNYSLRSNDELLLSPPVVKTLSTLGDRAFAAAAPKLWNQLPSELRRITFIDHFKRALKTYLFKQAFY